MIPSIFTHKGVKIHPQLGESPKFCLWCFRFQCDCKCFTCIFYNGIVPSLRDFFQFIDELLFCYSILEAVPDKVMFTGPPSAVVPRGRKFPVAGRAAWSLSFWLGVLVGRGLVAVTTTASFVGGPGLGSATITAPGLRSVTILTAFGKTTRTTSSARAGVITIRAFARMLVMVLSTSMLFFSLLQICACALGRHQGLAKSQF